MDTKDFFSFILGKISVLSNFSKNKIDILLAKESELKEGEFSDEERKVLEEVNSHLIEMIMILDQLDNKMGLNNFVGMHRKED